jgi:hypothetical protein
MLTDDGSGTNFKGLLGLLELISRDFWDFARNLPFDSKKTYSPAFTLRKAISIASIASGFSGPVTSVPMKKSVSDVQGKGVDFAASRSKEKRSS